MAKEQRSLCDWDGPPVCTYLDLSLFDALSGLLVMWTNIGFRALNICQKRIFEFFCLCPFRQEILMYCLCWCFWKFSKKFTFSFNSQKVYVWSPCFFVEMGFCPYFVAFSITHLESNENMKFLLARTIGPPHIEAQTAQNKKGWRKILQGKTTWRLQ